MRLFFGVNNSCGNEEIKNINLENTYFMQQHKVLNLSNEENLDRWIYLEKFDYPQIVSAINVCIEKDLKFSEVLFFPHLDVNRTLNLYGYCPLAIEQLVRRNTICFMFLASVLKVFHRINDDTKLLYFRPPKVVEKEVDYTFELLPAIFKMLDNRAEFKLIIE